MIIKLPQGPIRPIVEALDENEILHGWVDQLEDSALHQLRRLQHEGAEIIEEDGHHYELYHGIDGTTWALDQLFADYFPALQRAAAFLVIWGSFERHINDLCREVAQAGGYSVKVNDLGGKGLLRARTYLQRVAGLEGGWADEDWQTFPGLQRIRNLFGHGDGHIGSDETEQEYAAISPHLRLQDGVVKLELGFLPEVLQRQRAFLRGLEEAVVKRFGHGG